MELPASFILLQKQPRSMRPLLGDKALEEDLAEVAERMRRLWENFRPMIATGKSDEDGKALRMPIPPDDEDFSRLAEMKFGEMARTNDYAEIVKELERRCFWDPGAYSLTIEVATADPRKAHSKSFRFHLTEDQSRLLRSNVGNITRNMVGLPISVGFNFVYPPYEDAD